MMEDSTPDFQDLLAAFDIPDMRVKITEVRSLAPVVTSASSPAASAVNLGSPAPAASVKQEPIQADDDKVQTSWQQADQADGVGQPNEGLKALHTVASQLEGKGSADVPPASLSPAVTPASSIKALLNGAATNGDGTSNFFKPVREAASSSSQHAKVVSSTLMANSWAAMKSSSTGPVVSIAPKLSKADKPMAMPTALIRYTRPMSSAANPLSPNFITTAITASVRFNLVSTTVKSTAPPLIIGSRAPQLSKSKTSSSAADLTVDTIPKPQNASQSTTTGSILTGYPVLRISSSDLLKRNNPIPKLVPSNNNHVMKKVIEGTVTKLFKTRQACQECGDIFLADSSLKMHMERRSVQIAFTCDFCFSRNHLTFYNKCSYYAHLRQHSQQLKLCINYSSQANNVTVSSLTYAKPQQQQVDIIVKSDVVKVSHRSETASSSAGPSAQQPALSTKESANSKTPQGVGNTISKAAVQNPTSTSETDCHLCGSKFSTEYALQSHMQRYVPSQEMTCDHCWMTLPNKCQLRAHSIMHMSTPVFWTCPECARRFTSLKDLFHHVANACMHWYRQIRTRCKLCSKMVTDYEQHLDKGHEMLFYRCVSCSMAFKTLPSLKEHSERKHKVQPGSPLCRIISKCPFCETVFMQKPLLQAHIKMHIGQDVKSKAWVYCCPKCSIKISISLENFKKHMSLSHPSLKHFHCDFCRHNFKNYTDLRLHFQTGKLADHLEGSPDKICKVLKYRRSKHCKDSLLDSDDATVKSPETPNSPPATTTTDVKSTVEQPLSKLYVKKTRSCPGCKKSGKTVYFFREECLRLHMTKVHPEMKLSSLDSDECIKYVTIKPKDDEDKPFTKKDDEKSSPGTAEDSRKRSGELMDEKPDRKRPKFSLPTKFTCANAGCLYQTGSRADFKAHIESHRCDRSLSQCEECGTCFRIESAVRRHLFIQHGIRDYDAYISLLRGASPPPVLEDHSPSPSPVQELTPHESPSSSSAGVPDKVDLLECKVCYKTFQNEGILRTHMRNHGMAFIRSKRSLSSD